MRIVLVRPPFYALFGVTTPKMKTYPLNLICLATYVNRTGRHNAAIVDGENVSVPGLEPPEGAQDNPELVMNRGIPRMVEVLENADHDVWNEMERSILAQEPDLVGITANSGNMDTVKRLVQRLKRHDLPVILGGSHPTVLPEQSILYTDADMVISGEGEEALVDVMDSFQNHEGLRQIPSLAWRDNGTVKVNQRGVLIRDIDELPIPDRSLVNRPDYFGEVLITGSRVPVQLCLLRVSEHLGKAGSLSLRPFNRQRAPTPPGTGRDVPREAGPLGGEDCGRHVHRPQETDDGTARRNHCQWARLL